MTYLERNIVINALDQYIANGEELVEEDGDTKEMIMARALLERMQLQQLREVNV